MTAVWYATYGSNLDRHRMLCYVRGGCPDGASRTYLGCIDRTPPQADRPVVLPFRLYFGGTSSVWNGGVAFLRRHRKPDASTLGRAWLLTGEQFSDVLCQENGRAPIGDSLDLGPLRKAGELTLGDGWYEHLLFCGEHGGIPVVTVTSRASRPERAPSDAYVRYVIAGLVDAHGLTEEEARAYVHRHVT